MTTDSQIVLVDDFEQAINRLKGMKDKLPDSFEFEIAARYFSNLSFNTAIVRQRMMIKFESVCGQMGYSINHDYVSSANTYRYTLTRKKKALPAPSAPSEPVIDI